MIQPKLSDSPAKILVESCKLTGGDKPRPYLLGKDSSVGAGFIPARKGLNMGGNPWQ
jgi:hypothetical protein